MAHFLSPEMVFLALKYCVSSHPFQDEHFFIYANEIIPSAGVLNIPLKNYFCATFSFPPPSTIMLNLIGHWSIDYHAIQSNVPHCLYLRLHNVTISFLLLDCTQRYHRTMLLTAAIHLSL